MLSGHLRKPRLFFFAVTTALSIATVGLAAWALRVGHDKQDHASHLIPGSHLDISDIVGAGAAVTAASAVATLICLGIALWMFKGSKRAETIGTVRTKEALLAFALILWIATLIPATVFAARRSARLTRPGLSPETIRTLVRLSGENLRYNSERSVLSYVIVGWFAFLSTLISLILVSSAARHLLKHNTSDGQYTRRGVPTTSETRGIAPVTSTTSGVDPLVNPAAPAMTEHERNVVMTEV